MFLNNNLSYLLPRHNIAMMNQLLNSTFHCTCGWNCECASINKHLLLINVWLDCKSNSRFCINNVHLSV